MSIIGAKLAGAAGAGAPVVFFGLIVMNKSRILLNKSRILLNKSRILILHPHFSGPFDANVYKDAKNILRILQIFFL